jgi:2-keto-4-pentenoate hydratase
MLQRPDLNALASEMKAAQDSARQIVPFTTRLPGFDLATAYEVAHLIHRARVADGAKPVGRKIGFTNPGSAGHCTSWPQRRVPGMSQCFELMA